MDRKVTPNCRAHLGGRQNRHDRQAPRQAGQRPSSVLCAVQGLDQNGAAGLPKPFACPFIAGGKQA